MSYGLPGGMLEIGENSISGAQRFIATYFGIEIDSTRFFPPGIVYPNPSNINGMPIETYHIYSVQLSPSECPFSSAIFVPLDVNLSFGRAEYHFHDFSTLETFFLFKRENILSSALFDLYQRGMSKLKRSLPRQHSYSMDHDGKWKNKKRHHKKKRNATKQLPHDLPPQHYPLPYQQERVQQNRISMDSIDQSNGNDHPTPNPPVSTIKSPEISTKRFSFSQQDIQNSETSENTIQCESACYEWKTFPESEVQLFKKDRLLQEKFNTAPSKPEFIEETLTVVSPSSVCFLFSPSSFYSEISSSSSSSYSSSSSSLIDLKNVFSLSSRCSFASPPGLSKFSLHNLQVV
jgi:hypothetical protein